MRCSPYLPYTTYKNVCFYTDFERQHTYKIINYNIQSYFLEIVLYCLIHEIRKEKFVRTICNFFFYSIFTAAKKK